MAEALQLRVPKGANLTTQEGDDLFAPRITQASHGLALGNIVRRSSATDHVKAQANSEANIGVGLGLVIFTLGDDIWVLRASNSHTLAINSHSLGAFGTKIWLSQSVAGAMTGTEPVTGLKVYLGYVIDANTIHWEPGLRYNPIETAQ
jgi:hypothetical protein